MIPPALLLQAYASGWFPMGDAETDVIEWFSPDPRGIVPLDRFHVPARLERLVRQGRFDVRIDTAFREVMAACAERDDTWITGEIVESYVALHRLGHAHSVEAWLGGRLAGGLYGVALGGAFFGESMFHAVTGASKVALHALVERLRARGFTLLDVQWVTPHLAQFGAVEIPRRRYLTLLAGSLERTCTFSEAGTVPTPRDSRC
jgi:leucyl/phenylalanyl-tRNA--protein transferase